MTEAAHSSSDGCERFVHSIHVVVEKLICSQIFLICSVFYANAKVS